MRSLERVAFLAVYVVIPVAACDDGRSPPSDADAGQGPACVSKDTFTIRGRRKLDLLFVVDDSPAMAAMDAKLATAYPLLGSVLVSSDDPRFSLHVAVVSASLGGGRFADVPGCEAGGPGDRQGRFSHPAEAGLLPGETFMRINGAPVNFTKAPGEVLGALARLGYEGCPYPQPLEAARRALLKARDPQDPDNAGFLRDDAALGIAIITNQDDCSIPADSDLFDPRQTTAADPYGAAGAYRCAEFGWLCNGVAPPHALASGSDPIALDACVPDPTGGRLTPLAELRQALANLKASPDDVMISLIGGPGSPVVVGPEPVPAAPVGGAGDPVSPALEPSCTGPSGEADRPSVRLQSFVETFEANGVRLPACASAASFPEALSQMFMTIQIGEALCLTGIPKATATGSPSCAVTETHLDENGVRTSWALTSCDADRTVLPCWTLREGPACFGGVPELRLCRDVACSGSLRTMSSSDIEVTCEAACG